MRRARDPDCGLLVADPQNEHLLQGPDGGVQGAAAHTRRLAGSGPDPFEASSFEEFKNLSEKLFIQMRLERNGGNIKRTAEELGMQRSHMYKKLDRYGLR